MIKDMERTPARNRLNHILRVRGSTLRGFGIIIYGAFLSATLISPRAQGQLFNAEARHPGDLRIGVAGGGVIPNSVSFNGAGTPGGIPISGTGRIKLNPGPAFGGFIGYTVNDYVNLELLLGYAAAGLDTFKGGFGIGPIGLNDARVRLTGNTSIVSGFANVTFNPFGISAFTPYIGGGPGVAIPRVNIKSFGFAGLTLPAGVESRETDFAANFLVGADYRVAEQWELGLAYQYLWINSHHLGSGGTLTTNSGHITGHSLGAVLEYHF